jgi:hypothetical protein
MTPVDQTRFGKPDGNCYAACIASILDRPLEEFDNRPVDFENEFTESWQAFMATKGYALVEVLAGQTLITRGLHYIASGPSPRGPFDHAVVYRDGELVHDPHPSRDGVERVTWLIFVVPLR